MIHDCVAFGLRIRSAIEIPGAMAASGEPEVEIGFGTGELGAESAADGPYRVGVHGFEFAMPGVARYFCLGGNRVLIDRVAGASDDDVAAMLIATVLPALLWVRGDIVLHASAFMHPRLDRAVAVAGPSGAGKSTVLARMVADGASVIADDSVCLRRDGDTIVASGLSGGWYDPLVSDQTRRFNPVPVAKQLAQATLGHILILAPESREHATLRGADAIQALLVNRHRPRIARLTGHEAALLPQLAAICGLIPIIAVPGRSDDSISSWPDIFDIAQRL